MSSHRMHSVSICGAYPAKVSSLTLAEGEARGRAEGEARGRAEGEAQGELRALLTVLSARGIELSEEQAARVQGCKDIAMLEAWLRRAVTATRADQIFD